MKRDRMLHTVGLIAAALFLCAQMSAELTVRRCQRATAVGAPLAEPPRSVLALFIGKLEALVGDALLLKADNYFHGQTSLLGHMRISEEMEHEEEPDGDAEHDHADALGGLACHGEGLVYDHFLYRLYTKVAPTAHVHLHRSAEIVPWLYASVRLNPGNERAALVTAYWLAKQLERPREAETVLHAALGARPSSWRLRAELAWLHYDQGRFGPALRQCESAIRLFEPGQDHEQARADLAELWRLASACREALSDVPGAVACAERVVELLPAGAGARERLARLRALLPGN
jgi:tetratricopeptide (TPR) repeat protein